MWWEAEATEWRVVGRRGRRGASNWKNVLFEGRVTSDNAPPIGEELAKSLRAIYTDLFTGYGVIIRSKLPPRFSFLSPARLLKKMNQVTAFLLQTMKDTSCQGATRFDTERAQCEKGAATRPTDVAQCVRFGNYFSRVTNQKYHTHIRQTFPRIFVAVSQLSKTWEPNELHDVDTWQQQKIQTHLSVKLEQVIELKIWDTNSLFRLL